MELIVLILLGVGAYFLIKKSNPATPNKSSSGRDPSSLKGKSPQQVVADEIASLRRMGNGTSPGRASVGHSRAPVIAEIEFDYVDRHGDKSHRHVKVSSIDDEYFEGICAEAGSTRTFVIGRVRGRVLDVETGELLSPNKWADKARKHPANSGVVESRGDNLKAARALSNPTEPEPSTTEILFTGFKATTRVDLEALAESLGMVVRKSVTKNLTYVVSGPTAGPAKLSQAASVGAAIISESDFLAMQRKLQNSGH